MDLNERRQISAQINNLKSKCEKYTRIKEELTSRLVELNGIVDELVEEKRTKKYDPNSRPEMAYRATINTSEEAKPQPTVCQNNTSSETFRTKFFQCLQEVEPKAKEISDLFDER